MLGSILKFLIFGVIGIAAIGVLFAVLGIAFTLAALALKVGIVVAIGYGAVKLFQSMTGRSKPKELTAEERKWLES